MMTIELNHEQAKHLASLVAALRPGWDVPGVRKALWDARTKGTPDQVAHAAITAAMDPANRTPAVIALDGPHWAGVRPVETRSGDYDRCEVPGHEQWPAWHCAGCRADATATDTPQRAENPREPHEPGSGPDLVRAAMRIHGVPTTDELRTRRAAEQQNLTEPAPVAEPMEEA